MLRSCTRSARRCSWSGCAWCATASGRCRRRVRNGRFAGDVLGADPVATTERAAKAAVRAAAEPVRAGRTVYLSFGDTPAGEYAMQLAADHLVHAWDLSAAIGAGRVLPPGLVEQIAGWFTEREVWYRQGGVIDERPAADDCGDRQRGLLIAFGRDPDWAAVRAG